MKQINRSVVMGLLELMLLSGPCWALGEADGYWNQGIIGGKTVAASAAAWRPQGIKPLPVLTNPLDLGQLDRKLKELNKSIEEAMGWAKITLPSIGLQADDGSRFVKGLLPNAEEAGVRIGDEVMQADGQNVSNIQDVAKIAKNDIVELTLARGIKVQVTKQPFPTVSPEFFAWLKEQTGKYQKVLDNLKMQAQNPDARWESLQALGDGAVRLNFCIDQTAKALQDEQAYVYNNAYRH